MAALKVEDIARVCHEANRAYCFGLGDFSQAPWDVAGVPVQESAIAGVKAALADGGATPEKMHVAWMEARLAQGWKVGPVRAPDRLEHPCLVPYEQLPEEQRTKDVLFLAVVRALVGKAPAEAPVLAPAPAPAPAPQPVPDLLSSRKKGRG